MVKREFVSLRFYSDFPKEVWIKVVIPNPEEDIDMSIPPSPTTKGGRFAVHKAYFPHGNKEGRLFDLVLPWWKFRSAMLKVNKKKRWTTKRPVCFEFKRDENNNLRIRNYETL
jgi:hypothetical protein